MSHLPYSPSEIASYYRERAPKVSQTGPEWRGPCPVHGGADDNFTVNPDSGLAYCHSQCGKGWSILQMENELSAHSDDADQSIRSDADRFGGKQRRAFSV